MSFEFLAPDAAVALDGRRPPLRSPIEWVHRRDGATFDKLAGWRVVTGYGDTGKEAAACRDSVGVADVSSLGKLELQAEPDVLASIVARFAGAAVAPGRAALTDGVWWCPVTAGRVLALCEPEHTAGLRGQLEAAAADASFASVHELTTAFGSNIVAGPLARETFARTTALDLRPDRFPEAAFAPVSVARTPGMILRQAGDRYLHLFGAGFALYTWTVFIDAAEHLGGRAVGAEALRASQPTELEAHA
jgi:glycine cleavage system aminomethyltransferase T